MDRSQKKQRGEWKVREYREGKEEEKKGYLKRGKEFKKASWFKHSTKKGESIFGFWFSRFGAKNNKSK